MIESVILNINYIKGLTKSDVENYFKEKNLNVIKWAIVGIEANHVKILTSFFKKK